MFNQRGQQQLDVHFVVGGVHTGRVVHSVRVDLLTVQRGFNTSQLGNTQVPTFAHDAGTQVCSIDTNQVVRFVAHLRVGFVLRLDVRTDSAVVHEVNWCAQNRTNQFRCRVRTCPHSQSFSCFGRHLNRLRGTRENPTSGRNQVAVVVLPARARQFKQALALLIRRGRVRVRVDEDVTVVERGYQTDVFGAQHTVTKNVTAHVTDTNGREVVGSSVDTQFTEVTFNRLPRTSGRNRHRLVVVTRGTTRSESILQPEATVNSDLVRDVREPRCTLVGCDHQVRVVFVVANRALRVHGLLLAIFDYQVVCDVQQRVDEHFISSLSSCTPRFAIQGWVRQTLRVETALSSRRHNERVLNHLSLNQAQDFGAEVIAPVRPAQTTTSHATKPQVNTFDFRRVHEHFQSRTRLGTEFEKLRLDLEDVCPSRLPVLITLEHIGAYGSCDHLGGGTQNPVSVQGGHLRQRLKDFFCLRFDRTLTVPREVRVELSGEQLNQQT